MTHLAFAGVVSISSVAHYCDSSFNINPSFICFCTVVTLFDSSVYLHPAQRYFSWPITSHCSRVTVIKLAVLLTTLVKAIQEVNRMSVVVDGVYRWAFGVAY